VGRHERFECSWLTFVVREGYFPDTPFNQMVHPPSSHLAAKLLFPRLVMSVSQRLTKYSCPAGKPSRRCACLRGRQPIEMSLLAKNDIWEKSLLPKHGRRLSEMVVMKWKPSEGGTRFDLPKGKAEAGQARPNFPRRIGPKLPRRVEEEMRIPIDQ
jgi:hypothetical protein